MILDVTSKKQESYAKLRLAWQLETVVTSSIHEVLRNLLNSYSRIYNWSDEERQQIEKIEIVLNGILELQRVLVPLSQPLINTNKKPVLFPTTSTPVPIPTEDGDVTTSRQGLLPLQGGSLVVKRPGTPD